MGLFHRAPPTQSSPPPVALPAEVAASTSGSAESEDENLAFKTPCVVAGLSSAAGGASLGFLFGFGGYWFKQRLSGTFKASLQESWGSAKTFAIMSGVYAAATCFVKRIRQKEDAWNSAISGCATGLVLGAPNGPGGALQSCAMIGAFSYFMDSLAVSRPLNQAPGSDVASTAEFAHLASRAAPRARRAGKESSDASLDASSPQAQALLHLARFLAASPPSTSGTDLVAPPRARRSASSRGLGGTASAARLVLDVLSPAVALGHALSPCSLPGACLPARTCSSAAVRCRPPVV